jgi:prepilin-type processing-associated H-X9-DG protein
MKPRVSHQSTTALTLVEVLVVIAVLVVAVALILPVLAIAKRKSSRISCANDLKQVGIAFRLWEGDNNNKYPMAVSVTNGGAMELIATGNVTACFQVMSNEVNTPKILLCPNDASRVWATDFFTLNNSNISYFVGLDADESKPRTFLSGDDNFAMNGVPVKSGRLDISTNTLLFWTAARHKFAGNIGLADGSVRQSTTDGLRQALQQTGVATNRLALP